MNVMLTCAGRRTYSIEVFKEAVGNRSQVFACDSSADAPALQKADKAFVVPSIDHKEYIDTLLAICADHQIGLLVPVLEPELPLLATTCGRDSSARFGSRNHSYLLRQAGGLPLPIEVRT
jgi:carbamoyl-phosphate synthase large subunit